MQMERELRERRQTCIVQVFKHLDEDKARLKNECCMKRSEDLNRRKSVIQVEDHLPFKKRKSSRLERKTMEDEQASTSTGKNRTNGLTGFDGFKTLSVQQSVLARIDRLSKPWRGLFWEIHTDLPLKTLREMVWRNQHEDYAFQAYKFLLTGEPISSHCVTPKNLQKSHHQGPHIECTVSESGFVISEDKPFLGASPVGIINCNCCGKGVLEIHCPLKHRSSTLHRATADPSFCLTPDLKLRVNHHFHMLIQLQMYVCDALYGDLVVWTLNDCVTVRVRRDNTFICKLIEKVELVWRRPVLPELVTRMMDTENEDKENKEPPPTHNVVK